MIEFGEKRFQNHCLIFFLIFNRKLIIFKDAGHKQMQMNVSLTVKDKTSGT